MPAKTVSGISSIFNYGYDFIVRAYDKLRRYLYGVPPSEHRTAIMETTNYAVDVTKDLINKVTYLASKYNAPGKYIPYGTKSDDVKMLQSVINYLGIVRPPLTEDGIYGPKTKAAVMMLQKKLGVKVDGIFGFYTAQALKKYVDRLTSATVWWERLANIILPWIVSGKRGGENVYDIVRQGGGQVAPQPQPQPPAPQKAGFFESVPKYMWFIVGGLVLLLLYERGGSRETSKSKK